MKKFRNIFVFLFIASLILQPVYAVLKEANLSQTLKVLKSELEKDAKRHEEIKAANKEISEMKKAQAGSFADEAVAKAVDIAGLKVVISECDAEDAPALRDTADKIRDKIGSGVVFLASAAADKVLFTAMATKDAVEKGAHCGNIIREAAKICGGGGGGRPDMAQAGGKDASKIGDALTAALDTLRSQIGG